ncbi:MAG: M20/M25/M40 family metallo-hydrolase [Verrucomicrobia bacterium]|nr:M20/M25/M40 family metallo-hydrolase [Verrucomicrobiota bacterium]MBS0646039.1 M20/M25/M40 family metallo-hydrolase [Verrucomicrobiota bacterium]
MNAEQIFLSNQKQIFDDFFTFLRFPSIATDSQYLQDVQDCASWLKAFIENCGLEVQQWDEQNIPTLLATDLRAGPHKKTLLLYAHYDVQPVDPLNLWTTPPFEPSLRDGNIYARGASDDKGQCFYTLCAIRDFIKHYGSLPINLKFLIEGEEESGSVGLSKLLKTKKESLQADHLLVVDSGMEKLDQPTLALGARGILTMTLKLIEGHGDMHSGHCGGLAINPNRALVQLLAKLHHENGRVAIEGFYDDVKDPTAEERAGLDCHFDLQAFEACHGFQPRGMEEGVDPITSNWFRPTLEINGLSGGYGGEGFKTVIPSVALAKLSCRLVPDQKPDKIAQLVTDFLKQHTPASLKLEIEIHPGAAPGFRRLPNSSLVQLVSQSYEDVFKAPCKKILMGGSIPIVPQLMEAAHAEVLLIGTALPTNCIHAPNEHFSTESFMKGYLTIFRLLELYQVEAQKNKT